MKRHLMIVLMAVAAVAVVAAPGWAGQASFLSDTQLEAVHGGTGVITQDVSDHSDENVLTANTANVAAALNCDAGCIDAATNAVNVQIIMHSITAQQANATGLANTVGDDMIQSNIAYSRVGGGSFNQ